MKKSVISRQFLLMPMLLHLLIFVLLLWFHVTTSITASASASASAASNSGSRCHNDDDDVLEKEEKEENQKYDLQLELLDPYAEPISFVIPRDFVSLSLEWNRASVLAKSVAFRNLVHELTHPINNKSVNNNNNNNNEKKNTDDYYIMYNKQFLKKINIRVGGNSADKTVWDNAIPRINHHRHSKSQKQQYHRNNNDNSDNNKIIKMTPEIILSLYQMAQSLNDNSTAAGAVDEDDDDDDDATTSSVVATLILDLTMLQTNNATEAVKELNGIWKTLQGRMADRTIEGFEIGNEADLFGRHGQRPTKYSPNDYIKEYSTYLNSLEQKQQQQQQQQQPFSMTAMDIGDEIMIALDQRRQHSNNLTKFIRGGGFCCTKEFLDAQSSIMKQFQNYFYSWSFHHYPTTSCGHRRSSIGELLSDDSTDGEGRRIQGWSKFAQKVNILFHIGETNSVSCGGQWNVSNTLASALWSFDYLMVMAKHNVSRVNFHGGDTGPYTWFAIHSPTSNGSSSSSNNTLDVRPLFYGMFAWNWMTASPGTQIVPLQASSFSTSDQQSDYEMPFKNQQVSSWCKRGLISQKDICCAKKCGKCGGHGCNHRPGGAAMCCADEIEKRGIQCHPGQDVGCVIPEDNNRTRVKAWALRDAAGNYKVAIINKLLIPNDVPLKVQIRVSESFSFSEKAEVVLLKAREGGMAATHNLTFAGWTWDKSQSGKRKGQYQYTTLSPQGKFNVARNNTGSHVYIHSQPPNSIAILSFKKQSHVVQSFTADT